METNMRTISKLPHMTSLLFAACAFLGACAADVQDVDDDAPDVAAKAEAILNAWTPFTSEEYPPIICDGPSAFSQIQCTGRYCDNTRAYCQPIPGGVRGESTWTDYFSEEGRNSRVCPNNAWITGLSCRGSYCDDISLQCSTVNNVAANDCYWTGLVSEENGGLLPFGSGYLARGARCDGSFCDNLSFYVCRAFAP
jgi:hypothetical protein